jgi:putative addiction module component (TIGR02574 family)
MNQKIANILEQVYELTAEERAELIEALTQEEACEFASPEIARAWEEEVKRRIAAYDRGELEAIDISDITYESLLR